MNEAIMNALNDETLVSNEQKVEAIKKNLAPLVIPKNVYNEQTDKFKTLEATHEALKNEYNEFKQERLTDDEKAKEEAKEKAKAQRIKEKEANTMKSEYEVKLLFLKHGVEIDDEDSEQKELLSNIISEDCEKSLKLANNFISLLNKTKDNTIKETTTNLLNDTPKPIGGTDSSPSVSEIDQLQEKLDEAIKNKDMVAQAQITTQIFNASQKQNIN